MDIINALPNAICDSCVALAITSYQFVQSCRRANQFWNSREKVVRNKNITELKNVTVKTEYTDGQVLVEEHVLELNFDENLKEEIGVASLDIVEDSHDGNALTFITESIETDDNITSLATNTIEKQTDDLDKLDNKSEHANGKSGIFCSLCSKTYPNKNEFNSHLKSHSTYCDKCNIKFQSALKLLRHLEKNNCSFRKNVTDPSYVPKEKRTCEQCGKVFQYRSSLLKHRRRHNVPPQSCMYCDFVPESHFKIARHMEENHSHLKNIPCTVCGKLFFKEANLRTHMVLHTGVKNHVCEICGTSFALASNLLAHRRLHTGPVGCQICKKMYSSRSSHNRHVREVHSEIPVPVSYSRMYRGLCCVEYGCDYVVRTNKELIEHLKSVHKMKFQTANLLMENFSEFEEWKSEIEKMINCSYRLKRKCRSTDGEIWYYNCTGSKTSHVTNTDDQKNTYQINQGSCANRYFCISQITVANENEKFAVRWQKTHYGANFDLLDKLDKGNIAT